MFVCIFKENAVIGTTVPGRFGPVSFRPGSFRPGSFRPWVVSAKFGGSFRPDFFKSPWVR